MSTHPYGSGHGPDCAVLCDVNHGTDPRLHGRARPEPLSFHLDVPGGRLAALDLRDEIVEALKPLGIRVSLIDCGTEVYLAAPGAATLGDQIMAASGALAAADPDPDPA